MSSDAVTRELRDALREGGLRGSFLVRELSSGVELGIEPELLFPTASLVKIPLAIATLERIEAGDLDESTPVTIEPGAGMPLGPIGLSKFRFPARIALADLLYLSTSLTDNTAAEALFSITPPAHVSASMRRLGFPNITVRHTIRTVTETPAERLDAADTHLAHTLAIEGATAGGGHRIAQLDVTRANSGSARAFVDLLEALWTPSRISQTVAERVRTLLENNVVKQRLAPDFSSDASKWSSKTGTLLNLRHEIGVVEHADGQAFAVAALTESRVPASVQPGADALMAEVARRLHDHLRAT